MLGTLGVALLLLAEVTTSSLVTKLNPLEVRQGRVAYLHTGALQFATLPEADQCKVELVKNDPMTQRVGKLKPTVSMLINPPIYM